MQVEFKDKDLKDLYSNPKLYEGRYPPGVIKKFVKVVTLMYAVDTVTKVNLYGKYQVAQKKGDMRGIRAARLNDAWRLEFSIDEAGEIQVINLERISNHYE